MSFESITSEGISVLKFELDSLDSLSPVKRRVCSTFLVDAGQYLTQKMKNLKEGGVHVDGEVIHDTVPMIRHWAQSYHVVEENIYRNVLKFLGYKSGKNEYGCYLPDIKTVLINNPEQQWEKLCQKEREIYRQVRAATDNLAEAKQDFVTTHLNTVLLEEFIHRIGNESMWYQHLAINQQVNIDDRVVRFFNEAMTKRFVEEIARQQSKPYFSQDTMVDLVNRLPYQPLAEIVFFGANSPNSTLEVLMMVQNALLSENPGMSIEEILENNGYLKTNNAGSPTS